MPDDPLVKHAMASMKGSPSKGPAVIKDKSADEAIHATDGDSNFTSGEMDPAFAAEQQGQAKRVRELEGLLTQALGQIHRTKFEADVEAIRRDGGQLPPQESIEQMYQVCFSSDDPVKASDTLLAMFRNAPKSASPDRVAGLGAAGSSMPPTTDEQRAYGRSNRSIYEQALGANFSSDAIAFAPKFLAEMQKRLGNK
jgi:hypothetical protein